VAKLHIDFVSIGGGLYGAAKVGKITKRRAERAEELIRIRVFDDDLKAIHRADHSANLERPKCARNILLSTARDPKIPESEGIEPTATRADEQV
jgi:hypothetical protein